MSAKVDTESANSALDEEDEMEAQVLFHAWTRLPSDQKPLLDRGGRCTPKKTKIVQETLGGSFFYQSWSIIEIFPRIRKGTTSGSKTTETRPRAMPRGKGIEEGLAQQEAAACQRRVRRR